MSYINVVDIIMHPILKNYFVSNIVQSLKVIIDTHVMFKAAEFWDHSFGWKSSKSSFYTKSSFVRSTNPSASLWGPQLQT